MAHQCPSAHGACHFSVTITILYQGDPLDLNVEQGILSGPDPEAAKQDQ